MLSLFDKEEDNKDEGTIMKEVAVAFKNELAEAEINLVEKVEGKDREMKNISKLMAELEEEIICH